MKIERAEKKKEKKIFTSDFITGELYTESGDEEDAFIVTDERTIVYLGSGTQYNIADHFLEDFEFTHLKARLVVE